MVSGNKIIADYKLCYPSFFLTKLFTNNLKIDSILYLLKIPSIFSIKPFTFISN